MATVRGGGRRRRRVVALALAVAVRCRRAAPTPGRVVVLTLALAGLRARRCVLDGLTVLRTDLLAVRPRHVADALAYVHIPGLALLHELGDVLAPGGRVDAAGHDRASRPGGQGHDRAAQERLGAQGCGDAEAEGCHAVSCPPGGGGIPGGGRMGPRAQLRVERGAQLPAEPAVEVGAGFAASGCHSSVGTPVASAVRHSWPSASRSCIRDLARISRDATVRSGTPMAWAMSRLE